MLRERRINPTHKAINKPFTILGAETEALFRCADHGGRRRSICSGACSAEYCYSAACSCWRNGPRGQTHKSCESCSILASFAANTTRPSSSSQTFG